MKIAQSNRFSTLGTVFHGKLGKMPPDGGLIKLMSLEARSLALRASLIGATMSTQRVRGLGGLMSW